MHIVTSKGQTDCIIWCFRETLTESHDGRSSRSYRVATQAVGHLCGLSTGAFPGLGGVVFDSSLFEVLGPNPVREVLNEDSALNCLAGSFRGDTGTGNSGGHSVTLRDCKAGTWQPRRASQLMNGDRVRGAERRRRFDIRIYDQWSCWFPLGHE